MATRGPRIGIQMRSNDDFETSNSQSMVSNTDLAVDRLPCVATMSCGSGCGTRLTRPSAISPASSAPIRESKRFMSDFDRSSICPARQHLPFIKRCSAPPEGRSRCACLAGTLSRARSARLVYTGLRRSSFESPDASPSCVHGSPTARRRVVDERKPRGRVRQRVCPCRGARRRDRKDEADVNEVEGTIRRSTPAQSEPQKAKRRNRCRLRRLRAV